MRLRVSWGCRRRRFTDFLNLATSRRASHLATESAIAYRGPCWRTGIAFAKSKRRTAGGPRNEPPRNSLASPVDLGGDQGAGAGGGADGYHMGGHEVSAEFAIVIALLTLGSCYASYRLGQSDILERFRRHDERRRRWEEFED